MRTFANEPTAMTTVLSALCRRPELRHDARALRRLRRHPAVRRYLITSFAFVRHEDEFTKLLDNAGEYLGGGQRDRILTLRQAQVESASYERLWSDRERRLHHLLFALMLRPSDDGGGVTVVASLRYLAAGLLAEFGDRASASAVRNSLLRLVAAGLFETERPKSGHLGSSTRVSVRNLLEPGERTVGVDVEIAATMKPETSTSLEQYAAAARARRTFLRLPQVAPVAAGASAGGSGAARLSESMGPLSPLEFDQLHEQAVVDMRPLVAELLSNGERHDLVQAVLPQGAPERRSREDERSSTRPSATEVHSMVKTVELALDGPEGIENLLAVQVRGRPVDPHAFHALRREGNQEQQDLLGLGGSAVNGQVEMHVAFGLAGAGLALLPRLPPPVISGRVEQPLQGLGDRQSGLDAKRKLSPGARWVVGLAAHVVDVRRGESLDVLGGEVQVFEGKPGQRHGIESSWATQSGFDPPRGRRGGPAAPQRWRRLASGVSSSEIVGTRRAPSEVLVMGEIR